MAGRESAEDKIARIVRETMAGERQRQEDESDPNIGRLRRIIRDEVGSVLGDLLNDEGDVKRGRGRRPTGTPNEGDDDADDKGIIASIFG